MTDHAGAFKNQNPRSELEEGPHVIFKPHGQRTEYIVYCEPGKVQQWRSDKDSLDLLQVVQRAQVYEKTQSGIMNPSKQTLENVFGTSETRSVIEHILTNGQLQGEASHRSSDEKSEPRFLG